MFYFYVLTFQFQFIIFCQMMKNYTINLGSLAYMKKKELKIHRLLITYTLFKQRLCVYVNQQA